MKRIFLTLLTIVATGIASTIDATPVEIEMRGDRPGAAIAPTMYGLFFEDINFAADGGLYGEMVKNRSFEFHPDRFAGWNVAGNVEIMDDGPFDRNPHYVRLTDPGHHEKRSCVANEGYFGMAFTAGEDYRLSVWARSADGKGRISVRLTDPASSTETQVLAETTIDVDSPEWKKYTATLSPSSSTTDGELRIFLKSASAVDLEHISLFPAATYKGRENGMRRDIAQALEDLHPGVFRFPGGCIVEGADAESRYQWKNTVGPVENRPLNENRWQSTFAHRFYPDYFQSLGLGFYEYFQLCEDLGAEPLPVLNVGMICQFQNRLENQIPVDSLDRFITDAIDLVEFANGDTTTTWGRLRAEMGHPAPFNLKYLAVGNEQWGPEYVERLEPFVKALRAACPDIEIIGSSGPGSEGDKFDYLWPEMRRLKVDLVDEHFYRPEQWFLSQGNRYDNYDRKGPKVFAGEYACHGRGKKYNHFNAALMEAAFMTGLERNADIVRMATYAPLLAHVDGWQWRPDLIWFDNSRVAPSASYYVQQLYAANKGSRVIPLTAADRPLAGNEGQNGLFASAVIDDTAGCYIIKIANTASTPAEIDIALRLPRKRSAGPEAEVITLTADDPEADNTLDNPTRVVPVASVLALSAADRLTDTVPASAFRLYRIPLTDK